MGKESDKLLIAKTPISTTGKAVNSNQESIEEKAPTAPQGDWFDDECEYDDDDYGGDCYFCGGDGWIDGYEDDPLWFEPGEMERCASCGGSGRAKDMTIW